jgi:hypothetical protein
MITAVTARLASGDFSALILANTGRGAALPNGWWTNGAARMGNAHWGDTLVVFVLLPRLGDHDVNWR